MTRRCLLMFGWMAVCWMGRTTAPSRSHVLSHRERMGGPEHATPERRWTSHAEQWRDDRIAFQPLVQGTESPQLTVLTKCATHVICLPQKLTYFDLSRSLQLVTRGTMALQCVGRSTANHYFWLSGWKCIFCWKRARGPVYPRDNGQTSRVSQVESRTFLKA